MTDRILCLRYGVKREMGYVHFYAYPILLDTSKRDSHDCYEGTIEYISSWGDLKSLYRFYVWSQGQDTDQPRKLYAIEVNYRDLHVLDAQEIAVMHKQMKAVQTSLDKQQKEDGYADSFGRYVGRVAKALKAKYILMEYAKQPSANGYKFRVLEVGEGINAINNEVHQWENAAELAAV